MAVVSWVRSQVSRPMESILPPTLNNSSQPSRKRTITEKPPIDPEGAEEQFDFFQKVVMQEDYAMGSSAEPALKEGGLDHILFGRNEQGNQHFHRWIDKVLNSDNDKELNSLFSNSRNNK